MKKPAILLLATLFIQCQFSSLDGQSKYFELSGYATLNNSYLIGSPLQKWMNDDIKSGSPAFFNIGGTSYMSANAFNKFHIGVGFSLNIPPSHSIWGSNLFFGGRNELVLNPYLLALGMPFRFGKNLTVTAQPDLLMSFLTGKYSSSSPVNVDGKSLTGPFSVSMGSMGVGFGLSLGAEFHLGFFGLGVKYGARILKSAVMFNDNTVGAWSPTDSNKEDIKVDLGGSYLTIGIMLKIAKPESQD